MYRDSTEHFSEKEKNLVGWVRPLRLRGGRDFFSRLVADTKKEDYEKQWGV